MSCSKDHMDRIIVGAAIMHFCLALLFYVILCRPPLSLWLGGATVLFGAVGVATFCRGFNACEQAHRAQQRHES